MLIRRAIIPNSHKDIKCDKIKNLRANNPHKKFKLLKKLISLGHHLGALYRIKGDLLPPQVLLPP